MTNDNLTKFQLLIATNLIVLENGLLDQHFPGIWAKILEKDSVTYLKIKIGFSIRISIILFIRIRQLNSAKIIKKMTYNKENLAKFLFNQFWFTESITILDQHLPGIWAKECG